MRQVNFAPPINCKTVILISLTTITMFVLDKWRKNIGLTSVIHVNKHYSGHSCLNIQMTIPESKLHTVANPKY